MIIDISIKNFLSIKEKIVLSLEGSSSKRLENNFFNISEELKLLKTIAIYGANASGKSNILKAINFFILMIINSGNHKPSENINFFPFLLDNDCQQKPTEFEINFIIDNIKYNYGFSYNSKKIISEFLYYWPKGTKSIIFERENNKFKFNTDKTEQKKLEKLTLENNLYLSKSAQLNYKKCRKVFEYFYNNFIVDINPSWVDFTIKKISEDKNIKIKILEILKKADFGGIVDIEVKKERKKIDGFEFLMKDKIPELKHSKTEEDIYETKIIHLDESGNKVSFPISLESEGTKRIIQILGPLLNILEHGKILFIDEIELNLHPEISKLLVKMFNSKNNSKNAQLIFTTHDTNLLDNDLFRKDQIYLTSKKPNKFTELESLFDYDIRENMDFEKAYLNGRVGGVPFLDFDLYKNG